MAHSIIRMLIPQGGITVLTIYIDFCDFSLIDRLSWSVRVAKRKFKQRKSAKPYSNYPKMAQKHNAIGFEALQKNRY